MFVLKWFCDYTARVCLLYFMVGCDNYGLYENLRKELFFKDFQSSLWPGKNMLRPCRLLKNNGRKGGLLSTGEQMSEVIKPEHGAHKGILNRKRPKLLVIDNYDSFTYNLVQMFIGYELNIIVKRADKITIQEAEKLSPDYILVSPGPRDPSHAGISNEIIRHFHAHTPNIGRMPWNAVPE